VLIVENFDPEKNYNLTLLYLGIYGAISGAIATVLRLGWITYVYKITHEVLIWKNISKI